MKTNNEQTFSQVTDHLYQRYVVPLIPNILTFRRSLLITQPRARLIWFCIRHFEINFSVSKLFCMLTTIPRKPTNDTKINHHSTTYK